jgi:phosphate:Na+ symporter
VELIGSLLGGLGLFLVGIKGLGANLQSLAGRRLRAVVARATRTPAMAAAAGLVLGGLTQSSNAVTFIVTAMVQAGLLPLRRALPVAAFANPGTAGLVLLTTVDVRLAVLWLVGVVGLMSALNLDRGGRLKPALGALLGLGLMFLGLDLMKSATAPLAAVGSMPAIQGGTLVLLLLPFLAGTLVTALAQSSSTIAILALTLHGAGLLTLEQTALAIYGASLGSGGAVLLTAAGLRGAARRLALFQALLKAGGVALFLALFLVEHLAELPLVLALSGWLAPAAEARIGLLFLLLQLASAALACAAPARMERLLTRLSPDSAEEALARPHFLHPRAADHPSTALDLVRLEQLRLLQRLPALVDPLRAEPDAPQARRADLLRGSATLELSIGRCLDDVLAQAADHGETQRAVSLQAANNGLAALRETLGEFGDSVEADPTPALRAPFRMLAEALHLLLMQMADLAEAGDAEDAAILRRLTDDRSDMMDGMRRRLGGADLPPGAQSLLHAATAQFERAVWLLRRQVLLQQPLLGIIEANP